MLEQIHPYFKYVDYLFAIFGFLFVNRMFVQDPKLRAWIMTAVEESEGRVSIKLCLGAVMGMSVSVGFFVAMHFAKDHAIPDYYLYAICSLIAGIFGIREAGKVMSTKYTAPFGNQNNSNVNVPPGTNIITPVAPVADDPLTSEWKASGSTLSFEDWKTKKNMPDKSDT